MMVTSAGALFSSADTGVAAIVIAINGKASNDDSFFIDYPPFRYTRRWPRFGDIWDRLRINAWNYL
jgi:hypothetical protein